uniref:Scaffoldin C n=1 Tax=Ruminococcus flavefaciens TaxID=1265 RepID=G9FDP4_RUMFL|nr:scaffoldin C [Ruminococcus flavefaciens]AEV58709.1 scaffoldin C [Ruminococcus flavefaciens]
MKTKKMIIGAMAATMLSLSVCSYVPAVAADDTVQITVSKESAKAGGAFEVKVSVADIPATGIQCLNFALEYDSSLITIDSVEAGAATKTGAEGADTSSSMLPTFNSFSEGEGVVAVMWSTASDASYWLKNDGVFVTVSGKVSSNAKDGDVANIKVIPTKRDTYTGSGVANKAIDCGYTKGDEVVKYAVSTTNGSVTVGDQAPTSSGKYLKGDANVDSKVNVADAVAVLQYVANDKNTRSTSRALQTADCDGVAGITGTDAITIQKTLALS